MDAARTKQEGSMKLLFKLKKSQHGDGRVLFAWQPDGNFLATAGVNGLVHIVDRHGNGVEEIPLESSEKVLALEWDKDGDVLAVLQQNNPQVLLWEQASRSTSYLETNLPSPTFLRWSKTGPQLAVGNVKGSLLLYRKDSRKKMAVAGKHTRAITCGDWSTDNRLALGGQDNTLTISTADGNNVEQTELKYEPVDIQFATQKADRRSRESKSDSENTVSINMGGRTILLYNLNQPEEPVELAFQPRYGSIVKYRWFGDGYMMIGFSEGYVVVISTHMQEIGEELFSGKFHKELLEDMAFSPAVQRAATVGGKTIKVIDMADWKEVKSEGIRVDSPVDRVAWTSDGQILTVSTKDGELYNYLARMPTIHDAHGNRVAFMSSLREITISDTQDPTSNVTLEVSVEPEFVALGPQHCAVGMNNRVWFYRCDERTRALVNEREYLATVDKVALNAEYAAVMSDGRVFLHLIESQDHGERDTHILPEREDAPRIVCMAMTPEFLIIGSDTGTIEFFYLADWMMLGSCDLRHDQGIAALFPSPTGTRLAFIDKSSAVYLYNPVNGLLMPVPKIPEGSNKVLWDPMDWGLIAVSSPTEANAYIHSAATINGPQIVQLGPLDIRPNGDMIMEPSTTAIPHGHIPITVYNGIVTCQTTGGPLATIMLTSHEALHQSGRNSMERMRSSFAQNLALLRLKEAWTLATSLKSRSYWLALSGKAMEQLDIPMAIRVYRELGDAGMVMALQEINDLEDKNLLAGHIAMLFCDYRQAQDLFLTSSRPITALEMRRDLLHWDHALKLAETLSPDQVPELSLEYAKQLEFKGEYQQAHTMYEAAMNGVQMRETSAANKALLKRCQHGVARMLLRMGDLRRGLAMVNEAADPTLMSDAAAILESKKQFVDAAKLYTKAGNLDQAVSILISIKDFASAAPLMEKIRTPKLHLQYAKAKEQMEDYVEAARAYERARDLDSVVRLLLNNLNQPMAAATIVRRSHSAEAAQLVAAHCRSVGDYRGAIEFLLMSKRSDEAFELAQQQNEMATYSKLLGEGGTAEEYTRIAKFYEGKSQWGKAGEFYAICGQYHRALKLFLQSGEADLDKAIDVVGKARSDMLTHTLIDYLMGETDGVPKDPNHIFKLYMALGNYAQAAKTAIIIAHQEQQVGQVKVAHKILFETYKDLESHHIRVPQALARSLRLLHSYNVVKKLVKMDDHTAAALTLMRVASNVSKFPTQIVPILTTAVVECQRAGFKGTAFEHASTLMRPEYRAQVDPKLKKRIEQLVRHPNKEEAEQEMSPCPFPNCNAMLPNSQLECSSCMNTIPYCIVTTYHMRLDDWTMCPSCHFPALASKFQLYLQSHDSCPMCEEPVAASQVQKLENAATLLKQLTKNVSNEGEEGGDAATAAAGGGAPAAGNEEPPRGADAPPAKSGGAFGADMDM